MKALTKQEVKNVIDGKRTTERIPNLCSLWVWPDVFGEREKEMQEWVERQVCDVEIQSIEMPDVVKGTKEDPEYCWLPAGRRELLSGSYDKLVYLEDWEDTALVEEMYEKFPSPDSVSAFVPAELDHSKYVVARWWFCLFERHWSLRGMENALTDYYCYPDEVHRLFQKLTDFYIRMLERIKDECHADAVFVSDDLGTQTGPFFSPEIFRTFFKPYYKQLIDKAHELGMHFWLHSCGNIELFLEDLIEIGLDVIHPLQRYSVDGKAVAEKYGGKICFLAGFDVQRVIPFGSEEEVRAEARYMIETFSRPDGRFMITMGNASTKDWKKECLQALYDEIASQEDV